ncbi:putative peptidase [Roseivivax sp. THAF40]|uniref:aminopeptidase P family protein n=1 Tax=unclassified Roseivivax TaxID=2639302 RepID=UPI00126866C3|nr:MULTISPECIES: aminopeptidase P family protein [unclassified Roseivivax]QFS82021.1 putative peptidase [Roseivivax sp. THAF197b]QFT45821.1 putative peptidase [Roseivivax sp. THAF40]
MSDDGYFQSFVEASRPEQGPPRLAALRSEMARDGLDGFVVPRADAFQGEYVAPRDNRLAWLTGFTGSAGHCVVLVETAGLFVDGRYRLQARAQVASDFTPVDWPEVSLGDWINDTATSGAKIGIDPWLLSVDQAERLEATLDDARLVRSDNLIDRIWEDQPDPPMGAVAPQPVALAGEAHGEKIARLSQSLGPAAHFVLTQPDSLAWLLNIRGTDIPRNPVPHGFAILHATGQVTLFMAAGKLDAVREHLGDKVILRDPDALLEEIAQLEGRVGIDPATCPLAVLDALETAEIPVHRAEDPCLLPKACKNETEIAGARAAHLRDAHAMCRFLAWLDRTAPGDLYETDVVRKLEECRRETGALVDIAFETICGAGPHGAIVHYRVTEGTDAPIRDGQLLLVDSGGQYRDGTTDITRTIAIGTPGDEERQNFTRVLQGMIGVSRLRWPAGLAGRDIDSIARQHLWQVGLDYGHGTGHGVGAYLSVHEGPQRIARTGQVPLKPGMILSNEPGFYREGAYGIRIENLVVVQPMAKIPGQTVSEMLSFETLTYVPLDRRLIMQDMLTRDERDWIDGYHAECRARLSADLDDETRSWLETATAPL